MKYLTTTGDILTGEQAIDIISGLKNTSADDSQLPMWSYLELLMERIQDYYGVKVRTCGFTQLLDYLEDAGFLLKIE